jgi:cobalamin biosynthesis protein CbiD
MWTRKETIKVCATLGAAAAAAAAAAVTHNTEPSVNYALAEVLQYQSKR